MARSTSGPRRSRRSHAAAGDCEDYAIAKFVALRLAGIAPDDLRIVIMHDTIHGEHHAVAAARLDGRWLMLDNRRMAMVEDSDVRNYRPTFVIDQHGVMRYARCSAARRRLGPHRGAGRRECAGHFRGRQAFEPADWQVTARNCCAVTADNNSLLLPDLPAAMADGALQPRCHACIPFGENMARQIFSFRFATRALIDAILLTGIPSHQIR